MRIYRLTNDPGGLGLSCTAAGLYLAGTPLLRKTEAEFAPRPAFEIASLMKAAHGADGDATRLGSSLQAIARALNGGDLACVAIAAVLTRTPELSPDGARRLAVVDDSLKKYDPDEPRDWHGRWTSDGAAGPAPMAAPAGQGAVGQGVDPTKIQSKMTQLAIPEYTSPTQWRYLIWALGYGKDRGVSIMITRIRE
jgi:hypothetical protein